MFKKYIVLYKKSYSEHSSAAENFLYDNFTGCLRNYKKNLQAF